VYNEEKSRSLSVASQRVLVRAREHANVYYCCYWLLLLLLFIIVFIVIMVIVIIIVIIIIIIMVTSSLLFTSVTTVDVKQTVTLVNRDLS
jgi:hypothetical protein